MNIREMRKSLGDTQSEFAKRYNIPFRTVQNWEAGINEPPEYVATLLEQRIQRDLINRRTIALPKYSQQKMDLPKRGNYLTMFSWLEAVRDCLGEQVVFALDEALMCQEMFVGRDEEFVIWVYGNDTLAQYNGVMVLGNQINPRDVIEIDGVLCTNFNRTITDTFANENILDMQGITEALSYYYFTHGECFDGIYVPPEYQERFESLARDAMEYYDS